MAKFRIISVNFLIINQQLLNWFQKKLLIKWLYITELVFKNLINCLKITELNPDNQPVERPCQTIHSWFDDIDLSRRFLEIHNFSWRTKLDVAFKLISAQTFCFITCFLLARNKDAMKKMYGKIEGKNVKAYLSSPGCLKLPTIHYRGDSAVYRLCLLWTSVSYQSFVFKKMNSVLKLDRQI